MPDYSTPPAPVTEALSEEQTQKPEGAIRWILLAAVLLLTFLTLRAGLRSAVLRANSAPAEAPRETIEQGEAVSSASADPETAERDIGENILKVTPTAEELAELLGADPAEPLDALEPTDAVEPADAAEPTDAAEESAPSPEDAALTEESAPAGPYAGQTEKQMVFQGRTITITPEAAWNRFQPGDFVWDGDRLRYTGTAYEASFGIDVSAYHNKERGSLDWDAARQDGVEFAIIRAAYRGTTKGNLYEDPCFGENADGAHAAGLVTGAYLYSQAVSVEEALEEAEFLLARLEGHVIDGPVCYDWEVQDRSSRAWSVSKETATAAAAAFCARIAQEGYTPLIYESKYVGYMKYDQAVLEPYLRWYPQYPDRRASSPCPDYLYHMDLWQFSDRCTVAGIGKRTDGNLWLKPKTAGE